MNLYGCVFEGKQENHIVRLFVGCITVECSFVETFLGHHREFASGVCPRIVDDTLPTTPSYLQTHVPENLIVLENYFR